MKCRLKLFHFDVKGFYGKRIVIGKERKVNAILFNLEAVRT